MSFARVTWELCSCAYVRQTDASFADDESGYGPFWARLFEDFGSMNAIFSDVLFKFSSTGEQIYSNKTGVISDEIRSFW